MCGTVPPFPLYALVAWRGKISLFFISSISGKLIEIVKFIDIIPSSKHDRNAFGQTVGHFSRN
jgi:hypothetical protein